MSKRKKIEIPVEDDVRREAERAEEAGGDKGASDMKTSAEEDEANVEFELLKSLDQLKRLQAEFDNYRKRTDRERQEIGVWAQSMLVTELLPVLDDMERALGFSGEDEAEVAKGFGMVAEQLGRVLEQAGLERIPAVGEEFDPHLHEALMTEPVDPDRVGTVLEELVPGYRFKERVVRPSRVKVGTEQTE